MSRRVVRRWLAPVVMVLVPVWLDCGPTFGGGARAVKGNGTPMTWSVPPVTYHPDRGTLGQLTNAQADTLVAQAFARWQSVPFADLAFASGVELPGDINAVGLPSNNPMHWANFWRKPADGWSPVIYDTDGSIVDEMFGAGARFDILGASGLDHPSVPLAGAITGASIVINGAFFDGLGPPTSPVDARSQLAFQAIMVHEAGHFVNLDHSVVNHEMADDGDPDNDIYVPTMYPIAVDDEEAIASLNPDDEAVFATLYPSVLFSSSTSTMTGRVLAGGVPFQGAHVVARKLDADPRMYAYSGISGARFFPCNEGGICYPCSTSSPCSTGDPSAQGEYLVRGIPPGNYSLCVEQIDRRFSIANGTFVGPLATPPTLPGPEECFSLGESANPALDDPDDVLANSVPVGILSGLDILLDDLPSTDSFEPNNTLGAASTLSDLASGGADTSAAILATGGDLDFYRIPVQIGQTIRIDLDAAELGSSLDAVIGIYGNSGLIRIVDDTVDPDSSDYTLDPALTYVADFTGDLVLAVSSYPDLDLNGTGGVTGGPYWIRVIRDPDQDGDGVPDRLDRCPAAADDDPDDDMLCGAADNCPSVYNFGAQQDSDSDGVGDVCDNCSSSLPALFNFQSGAAGWTASGSNSSWHLAASTCTGTPLLSTMFVSNGNRGPSCVQDSATEVSQLISPTLQLPQLGLIDLSFDVIAYDELGSCSLSGDFDKKDARIIFGGPFNILNDCYPLATSVGGLNGHQFDLSGYAGQAINLSFEYDTGDSVIGHTFAVDNVSITAEPGTQNPSQQDSDGDGIGDPCDFCPLDPLMDVDADNVCGNVDNCPTLFNPAQDGGTRARMNNAMVSGGDIYNSTPSSSPATWGIGFSPDSQRVVYLADQTTDTVVEVYSAPSGGGGAVRLNPALPLGREVLDFAISPDSSRVVYRSDETLNNVYTLRSSPVAGGASTSINVLSTAAYAITADNARAVYIGFTPGGTETKFLFSVPIGGGASTDLAGSLVTGGNVQEFKITPDGSRVIFLADRNTDEMFELYSVPTAGGTVTKLNHVLDPNADVSQFAITPDGARVVFETVDPDFAAPEIMWSVPVDGGTSVQISGQHFPGGYFKITPDGSRVVHVAADNDGDLDLFSYAMLGGDARQLTFGVVSSGPRAIWITPDSARIVYLWQDNLADGIVELRSIPILGGASVKLNGTMVTSGSVLGAELVGGGRVVYRAQQDTLNADLYSVAAIGGAVTKLNPAGPNLDLDNPMRVSPDGATVVFRAASSPFSLYSVPVLGGTRIQVNPSLVAGGAVEEDFRISPNGMKILYVADQTVNDVTELYATALMSDPDQDGVYSVCDRCPNVPDGSQPDADNDGLNDLCDNCPTVSNPLQQDTETAAGPDATCSTEDDRGNLFGPDAACGTPDDRIGDGVGDACVAWTSAATGPIADPGQGLGAAWGDYDGDGDQDLYIAVNLGPDKLLRNEGGLVFTDATAAPLGDPGNNHAAIWGDYDNDGNLDLYVTNFGPNKLYHNQGGGTFQSLASGPVLDAGSGYGAAWADYDGDGDLDIYHARVNQTNKLFRNDNGIFVDATTAPLDDAGAGRGVSWVDYDNDGDLDIYLVNSGSSNKLFRNMGAGVFSDVTTPPLNLVSSAGRSSTWGDYDNDGDMDVYVSNAGTGNKLFRNGGGGVFTDVTSGPLADPLDFGTSAAWADYDNDGDLDLYLASQGLVSRLLRNEGGGSFIEATSGPMGDTGANFCAAWADADGDGDLDLFLSDIVGEDALLRNDEPPGNHWLHLDLRGTVSNRSGIGARVTALTGTLSQIREVSGGQGAGCQDSLTVEFGLGSAAVVDLVTIRWPSGTIQSLTAVPADQRLTIVEPEFTPPSVMEVLPHDGSIDVAPATSVLVRMSEPVDPATIAEGVVVSKNGVKVEGVVVVSPDGRLVAFDPLGPLQINSDYLVGINGGLKDMAGNAATPFVSGFDTGDAGSGSVVAGSTGGGGAVVPGTNANDATGFATAAVADVNADGLADALVGAPNADVGMTADAGKVFLVFGSPVLLSGGTPLSLTYRGAFANGHAGSSVASAGDLNGDGRGDFLIGSPNAAPSGADSGRVYLVFGNAGLDELAPAELSLDALAACAQPTLCGVILDGESAGDRAGAAVSFAGDLNGDGLDDILVGAPGASPSGRTGAGKVYAIFGPLMAGTMNLSSVGGINPGRVFYGQTAGDQAGAAVSSWQQFTTDMIDDLLIGAPGAETIDEFGAIVTDAGYVYGIHGGSSNLVPAPVGSGIIELSRVANGLADQVNGVVFLGVEPGGQIGRSVSGEADVDGDGVPDIMIGADQEAWIIPGDGPKTQSTQTTTADPQGSPALSRQVGKSDAATTFGAWVFRAGDDGNLGGVAVAGTGDVNGDGIDDVIIGAPGVSPPAMPGAGKAYVVYGAPIRPTGSLRLSDVGSTIPGLSVTGADTADALGRSVGGGRDLNADGVDDALVGAPFADTQPATPPDAGEAYIISPVLPGEATGLVLTQSGALTTLEWVAAYRASRHNVYRGSLAASKAAGMILTSNMSDHSCGLVGDMDGDGLPDATDSGFPAAGDAFIFLVTGENFMGEGSLGSPGQTPPEINDLQCP